jgi:hypothetical protein
MELFGWTLERPLGLALFAPPLLLWLWLRRRREPATRLTSRLPLWARLAAEDPREASGGGRGVPPRARLLLAALVLGALAVAAPAPDGVAGTADVVIVVDRSPSMHLPHPDGGTRLERALELAAEVLGRAGVPDDARVWRTAGEAPTRGAAPPPAWRGRPSAPAPEPDGVGDAGATLLTDRWRPHAGPEIAVGGDAVPGPVGEAGGREVLWDGEALVEGRELPPRRVAVDPAVPARLRRLVELWAQERGHALTGSRGEAELALDLAGGEAVPGLVLAPGWGLRGRLATLDGPGERWPSAEAPLVRRAGPGALELAPVELEEVLGDPAALAVAWGQLLDAALPPRADEVPLAERGPAGEERVLSPEPRPGPGRGPGVPAAAWLALAALLLALAARRPGTGPRLDLSRKVQ